MQEGLAGNDWKVLKSEGWPKYEAASQINQFGEGGGGEMQKVKEESKDGQHGFVAVKLELFLGITKDVLR